jgi:hypothetical protein
MKRLFCNFGHYVRRTLELNVSKPESLKEAVLKHIFD